LSRETPTATTSKFYAFDFIEKFGGKFFPWFQHLSIGDAASGQFDSRSSDCFRCKTTVKRSDFEYRERVSSGSSAPDMDDHPPFGGSEADIQATCEIDQCCGERPYGGGLGSDCSARRRHFLAATKLAFTARSGCGMRTSFSRLSPLLLAL
jgi:hypothetical protein